MTERNAYERLTGRGTYPVEYASGLLNPLRNLIAPASRVIDRLSLRPTDQILELGCGPGYFSPAAAHRLTRGHITLFDVQQGMIDIATRRLRGRGFTNFTAVQGNAESLPFADLSFNVVFMVTVLGEIEDGAAAVREIARVLASGGLLSVTEQWGDPDRLRRAEIDALADQAELHAERAWPGFFIETFNYRKKD